MRTHFESHRSERIGWLRAAGIGVIFKIEV
jgi:hypothetical protein